MDKNRFVEITEAAVESGVCDAQVLDRLTAVMSIDVGSVSREDLLHTYRRRLKRTTPGSQLRIETIALLSFLEKYEQDALAMVGASLEEGGSEIFLMDSEGQHILHWMRMFSR